MKKGSGRFQKGRVVGALLPADQVAQLQRLAEENGYTNHYGKPNISEALRLVISIGLKGLGGPPVRLTPGGE